MAACGARVGLLLVCLATLFSLTSCGYRPVGGTGNIPLMEGKRLAVPLFGNRSYRPNLEAVLTDAVKNELASRIGGDLADVASADMVLTGTVSSFVIKPVAFSRADRITRYDAELTAEVTLKDRAGAVVWRGELSDHQDFSTDSDISVQLNREDAAVKDLCRRLAQRMGVSLRQNF